MEKTYKWDSNDYAQHSSAQYAWAEELIDKLRLKGTESVLDIGCGDGKVTFNIAHRVPDGHVTGIDNSKGMIALAKQRLFESSYQNVQFSLMNATALTFENQFEVVFSNAALHWTKDHVVVLEGVKRSLKPSGRLLFQMGGRGNATDIIETFNTLCKCPKWHPYFKDFTFPFGFYGPEEYEQWLKNVGLIQKRLELIPKDMKHLGKEGLAGWIRTTWLPYTERIPEHLRDTFISDTVDAYIQSFPMDRLGYIHVKMMRLEVEAINP